MRQVHYYINCTIVFYSSSLYLFFIFNYGKNSRRRMVSSLKMFISSVYRTEQSHFIILYSFIKNKTTKYEWFASGIENCSI